MIKIRIARYLGLALVFIMFITNSIQAVQRGCVQYTIPTDYSVFDEAALNNEAETKFQAYLNSENPQQQFVLLTQLLSDYKILGEINNENPLYFARLGIIYDKLGKDRYAKSNFFRSANLVHEFPYTHYAFGNFLFDRQDYRKALKEYKKAYDTGYSNHYYTIYQIGRIYEKFGDFSSSIKYYKNALIYQDSEELRNKIHTLEGLLDSNSLYNKERGVRK